MRISDWSSDVCSSDLPGDTRSPLTTCCQDGPATILWQETTGGRGMRRADRLFQIIQELRRLKLVTARQLAEALEVSERTIYRDIKDLAGSGVPIEGEAGVGYVLQRGYDLPPLMFTAEEIEALVRGARIIESWADAAVAKATAAVAAQAEAVLTAGLRDK